MANIQTTITITHGKETIQTIKDNVLRPASKSKEEAVKLMSFFNALAGTDRNGKLAVQVNSGDAVAASGTITFSSFAATNTFTIGSQTFTCMASGATGQNQFNVGGSDTISAASAAAVINSNAAINQYISASSAGAVITLACLVPGTIGNLVNLAISAHGSVSAAFLTSGAQGTTYTAVNTYRFGV